MVAKCNSIKPALRSQEELNIWGNDKTTEISCAIERWSQKVFMCSRVHVFTCSCQPCKTRCFHLLGLCLKSNTNAPWGVYCIWNATNVGLINVYYISNNLYVCIQLGQALKWQLEQLLEVKGITLQLMDRLLHLIQMWLSDTKGRDEESLPGNMGWEQAGFCWRIYNIDSQWFCSCWCQICSALYEHVNSLSVMGY